MTDWSMCLSPETCCQMYSAVSGRTIAQWTTWSDWKRLSKRPSPEKSKFWQFVSTWKKPMILPGGVRICIPMLCPSTSRAPDSPSPPMERLIIPISSPMPASPQPEEQPSTRSQRKIALFQRPEVEEPTDLKRTILELPQLSKLLQELRCQTCPSNEGLVL
ncbi:hypothetical protein PoB_003947300 [Plakobranchus ocellatus]|uniref:Uncharacterized protein n=1 Tax=Plakobranchus ocellatus TaxID=259542 RepID=A0AAV4B076_9GAST|nr:hypothetical protein PoB_003947300 [Plakobranchus ocellatus]